MWVNGEPSESLLGRDRGLQYGDGLFETLSVREGVALLLDQHIDRLSRDSQRLGLSGIDFDALNSEIHSALKSKETNGVLKILITAGAGGRGYYRRASCVPNRILSLHDLPPHPAAHWQKGINLRTCAARLSRNPQLAGIKHLNRLEQVLARNEWHDADTVDGLMQDVDDNVVETINCNLFSVLQGVVLTPDLEYSGVSGIMRAEILKLCEREKIQTNIGIMNLEDLYSADEVFVTNSVIGVWPVKQIDQQQFNVGPITTMLQQCVLPHIAYTL